MSLSTTSTHQTAQPLAGLLVIAMEQAVAAPLCTSRLCDAGARVIKIERDGGDFARGYDQAALGDSSYFAWLNHGKESLTLNYKEEQDKKLLHRLMDKADVFVQNLAPGVLARNGFSDELIQQRNPRLITCNISGYGSSDKLNALKGYDLLVQAESGLLSVSGAPNAMGRIGVSLCDIGCGVSAHAGILEALIQRSITGCGSTVNVSLFDVAAEWMSVPLIHAETGPGAPEPMGLHHPSIAPYGAFKTRDGELTILAIQNEREWHRLCHEVLRLPQLLSDERFTSNDLRVENRAALQQVIEDVSTNCSADEFRQRLTQANIAYGAINSVEELSQHSALRRRIINNSTGDALSIPAHPFHDEVIQRQNLNAKVPKPGEHTQVIQEEFGKAP